MPQHTLLSVHARLIGNEKGIDRSALFANNEHIFEPTPLITDSEDAYFSNKLNIYDERITLALRADLFEVTNKYQPQPTQYKRVGDKDYMRSLAKKVYESFLNADIETLKGLDFKFEKRDKLFALINECVEVERGVTYNKLINMIKTTTGTLDNPASKKLHEEYVRGLEKATEAQQEEWRESTMYEVEDDFFGELAEVILQYIHLDTYLDAELQKIKEKLRVKKLKSTEQAELQARRSCLNKIRTVIQGNRGETEPEESLPLFLLKNNQTVVVGGEARMCHPHGILVAAESESDALSVRNDYNDNQNFDCIKVAEGSFYTKDGIAEYLWGDRKGLQLLQDDSTYGQGHDNDSATNWELNCDAPILENVLKQTTSLLASEPKPKFFQRTKLKSKANTIKDVLNKLAEQKTQTTPFQMDLTGLPLFLIKNAQAAWGGSEGFVIAATNEESARQIALKHLLFNKDDNAEFAGFLQNMAVVKNYLNHGDLEAFSRISDGSVYREEGIVLESLDDS